MRLLNENYKYGSIRNPATNRKAVHDKVAFALE